MLLVATALLGAGGWLIGRRIRTARAVEADLREADRLQRQSAFPEAGAALEQARSRLGDGGPFWLYPVVEAARRDHQFLVRLEAIRLNRSTLAEGQHHHGAVLRFNKGRADRDYAEAFRDQGLGEPPDDPEGVAARIRASKWAAHLSPRWMTGRSVPPTRPGRIGCWAWPPGGPRPLARPGRATRRPGETGRPWPSWRRRHRWRSSPYRCCWRWANG